MELTVYFVDAFAKRLFTGNPAAVCILTEWLDDPVMQAIAMEINLSETAFVVKKDAGYRIRWFTPTHEVKLCGHATLASAHVLWQHHAHLNDEIIFYSLSGVLKTRKQGALIELDFPSNPVIPVSQPENLGAILGETPRETWANDDLIVIYKDPVEIEIIEPDFTQLKLLPYRGVCAVAVSESGEYDLICRFFAPAVGINEDPVTGSLYTQLGPLFTERLGKPILSAKQISKRTGEITIEVEGDRVLIRGQALTTMISTLYLDDI